MRNILFFTLCYATMIHASETINFSPELNLNTEQKNFLTALISICTGKTVGKIHGVILPFSKIITVEAHEHTTTHTFPSLGLRSPFEQEDLQTRYPSAHIIGAAFLLNWTDCQRSSLVKCLDIIHCLKPGKIICTTPGNVTAIYFDDIKDLSNQSTQTDPTE